MARIPSKQEHQAKLMALDLKERRAIVRAVNRGRAVEKKAHAPLAVGIARRQQRFWKYAWLMGPALGIVQLLISTVEAAITNAIIGTLALGIMSAFWLWRTKRAEERNLALMEGRRPDRDRRPPPNADEKPTRWTDRFRRSGPSPDPEDEQDERPAHPRGHLPGERAPRAATGSDGAGDRDTAVGPGGTPPKPPQPRGRKRR